MSDGKCSDRENERIGEATSRKAENEGIKRDDQRSYKRFKECRGLSLASAHHL